MKKTITLASCLALAISFGGCKKETTADKIKKETEKRDNYVQKQANKYTQSITGAKKTTKQQK